MRHVGYVVTCALGGGLLAWAIGHPIALLGAGLAEVVARGIWYTQEG